MPLTADDVILLQGDSITDAGRDRQATRANHIDGLGRGYAYFVAAELSRRCPGINCYNRGISGNRVTDLEQRWQTDALDLRPTVVSILIGVNDTWHGTAKGTPENGVPLNRFESIYRELIDRTRTALPGVRLVLCEPFVTEAGATLELAMHPDIDQRRAIVKQIADEQAGRGDTLFVPFQRVYDEAIAAHGGTPGPAGRNRREPRPGASPAFWAPDGVHPSVAGHRLMADAWLRTLDEAGWL